MVAATNKARLTKAQQKRRRLTKAQRLDELKQALSLCFAMLDCNNEEAAKRTGLCEATIWRLRSGEHTLAVRYGTVQAMAYAAGMRLDIVETGVYVTLLD